MVPSTGRLRNSEARGPDVSANRTKKLNKLTEATARRRLTEEEDGGPVRGNRKDEARRTARRARHHRAHERLDSELREFADAGARRRLNGRNHRRRLRGSRSLGGRQGSDAERSAPKNGVPSEP